MWATTYPHLPLPSPPLPPQIARLASGMRCVDLNLSTEERLEEAVDFVRRCQPLQHTAPVKKSQVLCL